MAKLTITVDTETKMIEANVDGTVIGEISDVSIYNEGGRYFSVNICTRPEDMGGFSKTTYFRASGSDKDWTEHKIDPTGLASFLLK